MKKYFKIQLDFQKQVYDLSKLTEEEKIEITKTFILCAHKELSEVLDCFNWKTHRKIDTKFVQSNLEEEIIDVFKYLINICIFWNIDEKIFEKAFDKKTEVVLQRRKQEFLKPIKGEKVCAIDLDDTLNEWHKFFVKTFNEKNGTHFLSDAEIRRGTNSLVYADFKHWWRNSGVKKDIPVKKGAAEITKYLKKQGYRIVIISSRPYKQYFRLFPDTIDWLNDNKITFDDIYFEEDKHLKILKYFPELKFMIENDMRYVEQVVREGYKVFYLNEECNGAGHFRLIESKTGKELSKPNGMEKFVCIHSLDEIKKYC